MTYFAVDASATLQRVWHAHQSPGWKKGIALIEEAKFDGYATLGGDLYWHSRIRAVARCDGQVRTFNGGHTPVRRNLQKAETLLLAGKLLPDSTHPVRISPDCAYLTFDDTWSDQELHALKTGVASAGMALGMLMVTLGWLLHQPARRVATRRQESPAG